VTIVGSLTVAGVQFKLDGNNLGAEDTSAPYAISWDTTRTANGSHTLTAVARDQLGLRWTSDPVTVTVSNGPPPDTTPPTVSITSPASGSTVTGTINVTANASDNVGVKRVDFYVNSQLVCSDATPSYACSWVVPWQYSSTTSYQILARAYDAAGNWRASTVTVFRSKYH
jgi:hypothetical protein